MLQHYKMTWVRTRQAGTLRSMASIASPSYVLQDFRNLMQHHRNKLGPIVEKVKNEKMGFSPQQFHCFSVNQATRTLLTIPEVFKVGSTLALHYHALPDPPTSLAHSAAIAADEGGVNSETCKGDPHRVHSHLMVRAFNTHRQKVFKLSPLPLKEISLLLYTRHILKRLIAIERIKNLDMALLKQIGVDNYELKETLEENLYHLSKLNLLSSKPSRSSELSLLKNIDFHLYQMGILDETLQYCEAQYQLMQSISLGEIIGTAWGHEQQADSMMETQRECFFDCYNHPNYYNDKKYMLDVSSYFDAHRDDEHDVQIEEEHAMRMDQILESVLEKPKQAQQAFNAAEAYLNRQFNLSKAMYEKLLSLNDEEKIPTGHSIKMHKIKMIK